ncbi:MULTISPECIES: carboxymuconolactone decarboxylase family protein [Halomonadaceae]|jgi:alkylhydroperoxidase family enzyme|uniref:carboxymuconolactone decarboxylase family protein n=1 Tax=Halomonadaceae TaxID=28256 RepID=UPI000480CF51|nr:MULTISPECIES: carboxymuconolactone decarboxylase family protein [Halomonas]MCD1586985.1 carboxymuconolactone decarboxylase family protein [Halomonas sp. IOP_14]PKH58556.1 carboxymuconolactone decarboxylase family protein [Halomonas sp. Choline-3u-9]TMU20288.1 carboxymuconolactone decarboxylase family protein [Halomonas sp. ATBC28]CAD5268680.1 Carboxymuconolactone decarboxylase family protein [Halomonas sp. I3]CAD5274604.1 Carboxymuconolactone decarboxylase family protein [Halomonas sp. 113]
MPSSPCPPISDADWPEEIPDLREGFAGALNVYRTMAHHPALLRAWAPLRQHVVKENALGPELTEVVILRAGLRMGSAYEWAHHVSRALALGFSEHRITAIRGTPEGVDGLIVNAVDALFDERMLAKEQEAELAEAIGRKAVIDLIAMVGFYSVLGYLLKTYDTPIDDTIQQEAQKQPELFSLMPRSTRAAN